MLTAFFCTHSISQAQGQPEPVRNKHTPFTTDVTESTLKSTTPVGHPTFMSPHTSPIAVNGDYVFVVNTSADTLDVIDTRTRAIAQRINVGIDPVSIAVRPDGKEIWGRESHFGFGKRHRYKSRKTQRGFKLSPRCKTLIPKLDRPDSTNRWASLSRIITKHTLRCRQKIRLR